MTNSAKQIRSAKPEGKMTRVSGTLDIVFENGVTFTEETPKAITSLWNKLERMGYDRVRNHQSDEFDGLCEANKLGLEFPAPQMLSR